MNFVTKFGASLAGCYFLKQATNWLLTQSSHVRNEAIGKVHDLFQHVCHGCSINRFLPISTEIRNVINLNLASGYYTETTARELNDFLNTAQKEQEFGTNLERLSDSLSLLWVGLFVYSVYLLRKQVNAYMGQ